jgi:hypothetical protein
MIRPKRVFPNYNKNKRLHGCVVVHLEEKLNKGKLQECAVFTNEDIKRDGELVELHCVQQYFIMDIAGARDEGLPDVGEMMRRTLMNLSMKKSCKPSETEKNVVC